MPTFTNKSTTNPVWGTVWDSSVGADPVPSNRIDPSQSVGWPSGYCWVYANATIGVKQAPFAQGPCYNADQFAVDPDALTLILTVLDPVRVQNVKDVAARVAQSIDAGKRDPINQVLTQLASDPLTVLQSYGLDSQHFAQAIPSDLAEFEQLLKDRANAQLNAQPGGRVPRASLGCWSCTIGFGALIIGMGVAMSASVAALGGALYAPILAFVSTFVAEAAAINIANGISAAGLFVGEKIIEQLIDYVCSAAGACD